MTLQEIKDAISQGLSVKWATDLYDVIKDKNGNYLIICRDWGKYCTGLTWRDGVTLNGEEEQFYIKES